MVALHAKVGVFFFFCWENVIFLMFTGGFRDVGCDENASSVFGLFEFGHSSGRCVGTFQIVTSVLAICNSMELFAETHILGRHACGQTRVVVLSLRGADFPQTFGAVLCVAVGVRGVDGSHHFHLFVRKKTPRISKSEKCFRLGTFPSI